MKHLTKISLVLLIIAALGGLFDTLSAKEFDPYEAAAKRENMRSKIERMREEIQFKGYTFTVDFNPAMQYSLDQLCSFKPELKPTDLPEIDEFQVKPLPSDTYYMSEFTSVKDQGNCGSCWAFSTAGMFEAVLLKKGINTDLSEQWLVSCNTSGWGCNGGNFANSYYLNPGAVLESCFRYKASDVPCKTGCPYVYIAKSSGNASSVDSIKNAIKTYGAVSCAVVATVYFQAYSGGVFNYDAGGSLNHAIVLVGWDDTLGSAGAWRLKNSWGRSWGESGLMWIEYGCSGVGSGGNYLTY